MRRRLLVSTHLCAHQEPTGAEQQDAGQISGNDHGEVPNPARTESKPDDPGKRKERVRQWIVQGKRNRSDDAGEDQSPRGRVEQQ